MNGTIKRIRRILLVGTTALLVTVSPTRATVIVFDPTNFGVNLEQVAHHLELIARLDAQIRNQLRMLENWRFSRLDDLLASMAQIQRTVHHAAAVDYGSRYPIAPGQYARRTAAQMNELRREWLRSQRESVVQSHAAQREIVTQMPGTRRRIAEYMEQSRRAPGQTAVLQASNETIATLAGQLQALQALELADTRIELEAEAQRQAEAIFHRQRRESLMRDWHTLGGAAASAPIKQPFGRR